MTALLLRRSHAKGEFCSFVPRSRGCSRRIRSVVEVLALTKDATTRFGADGRRTTRVRRKRCDLVAQLRLQRIQRIHLSGNFLQRRQGGTLIGAAVVVCELGEYWQLAGDALIFACIGVLAFLQGGGWCRWCVLLARAARSAPAWVCCLG